MADEKHIPLDEAEQILKRAGPMVDGVVAAVLFKRVFAILRAQSHPEPAIPQPTATDGEGDGALPRLFQGAEPPERCIICGCRGEHGCMGWRHDNACPARGDLPGECRCFLKERRWAERTRLLRARDLEAKERRIAEVQHELRETLEELSITDDVLGRRTDEIASLESKLAEAERTVSKLRDRFPDDVWAELLADDPTPRTCKTCIGYIKPRRDCAECGGTGCGSTDAAGRGEKA